MSQEEVYKILEGLGGTATTKQISRRAKEKFPKYALWSYVGHILRKLKKNGYVIKVPGEGRQVLWKIIREYP